MGHPGAAPRAWTSSLSERLPACNPSILPASAGTKGLAGTLLRRYVPSARSKVLLVDFAVFCPPERCARAYAAAAGLSLSQTLSLQAQCESACSHACAHGLHTLHIVAARSAHRLSACPCTEHRACGVLTSPVCPRPAC